MGGRGSSYFNRSGSMRIKVSDTYDQDKPTNNRTRIVEKLTKRNVQVMASTDKIPDEILTPNLKQLDRIMSKFRQYSDYAEVENLKVRTETFSNPNVKACFRCQIDTFKRPEIIFNKSYQRDTAREVETQVQKQIEIGYWTKSDRQNLLVHTMTHEMGHYVQRVLTEQIAKQRGEVDIRARNPLQYDDDIANEMRTKIRSICKNTFHTTSTTSIYGTSDPYEFFAETFSEMLTCDNPSDTAKSLEIYLKGEK